MNELLRKPAREVVRLLERREVSPVELAELALARIAAVDGAVNAVPTVCAERALEHARRLGDAAPPDDRRGWLGGLPVVIKDLNDVAGVRTTYGSPIFKDHVPDRSGYEVERLESRGAVVLGKSNTPELGAGANTFNEVFGITRNPWDTRLTCGGSSGGAAVALATGMAWLANGSDLGGSLRTPASFCSVVGLRPSPGRVPHGPSASPFQTLSVEGPMARDVRDLALMLDAQAGFDPRDPISFEAPVRSFAEAAGQPTPPRRVAFSADLGVTPVDAEVAAICRAATQRFAELGALVEEASPDLVLSGRGVHHAAGRKLRHRPCPAPGAPPRPAQARGGLEHRARVDGDRRRDRTCRASARPDAARHGGLHGRPRPALLPGRDRAALPGRAALCRGAERAPLPELHRLGRHQLRDHAHRLPGLVPALRLHQHRSAGRACRSWDGPAARPCC